MEILLQYLVQVNAPNVMLANTTIKCINLLTVVKIVLSVCFLIRSGINLLTVVNNARPDILHLMKPAHDVYLVRWDNTVIKLPLRNAKLVQQGIISFKKQNKCMAKQIIYQWRLAKRAWLEKNRTTAKDFVQFVPLENGL
tara:strand:+ start:47 stop:466 length:420 start_codon:yes stop_codon:yes gene_type:complete